MLRSKGYVVKTAEKAYKVAGSHVFSNVCSAEWHDFAGRTDIIKSNYDEFFCEMGKRSSNPQQNDMPIGSEFGFKDVYVNALKRVSTKIEDFSFNIYCKKHPELVECVITHLKSVGIDASASNIMFVSSYRTGLYFIYMRLLNSCATLFTVNPSIALLSPQVRARRAHIKYLKTDSRGIVLPDFIAEVRKTSAPVLYMESLCTWPSGTARDPERAGEIAGYCRAHAIPVIEGDSQRELWFGRQPHKPLKASDSGGNILYVSSFLTDLCPMDSFGFIVGPEYLIQDLSAVYSKSAVNSQLTQLTLLDLFKSGDYDAYVKTFIPMLRARMEAVLALLDTYLKKYASWERPSGGVYIVLTFKPGIEISRLNMSEHVLCFPLVYYGNRYKNAVAVAVTSCPMAEMEAFIRRLAMEAAKLLT